MVFNYIDVHSHLNLDQFDADRESLVRQMNDQGIATITVGVDFESSKKAIEIAEQNENFYACVGMHPVDNSTEVFDVDAYMELANHPKVVAVGECGLDYFRLSGNPEEMEKERIRQTELFIQHIWLVRKNLKTVMIHARPSKGSMDAYIDALNILETHSKVKANFHFFVGDVSVAKRIVDAGHTVSFDGPITFTDEYNEVIKFLPLTSIMAETDAPFAAPVPYRGKRCQPDYVVEIYKKIAEIKGLDPEMVRLQINQNAKRVFGIV